MKRIKKVLLLLVTIVSAFSFTSLVNAASANISVSTNKSVVAVGGNVTVTVKISSAANLGAWDFTLNYDSNKFSYVNGSDIRIVDYGDSATKSRTYTYTFKARTSGSANFTIISSSVYAMDDNSKMSVSNGSRNVTIKTQAEIEASYSKNNDLSALSVSGYESLLAFNKETLEYSIEVPSIVTSIKINAKRADSNASVSGAGDHEVTEGLNKFAIVVTAQNGAEKTYIVNVNVIDQNPINVSVNGVEYSIVKKAESLTKPQTYTEGTTMIEGVEVPAFTSEVTGFTLVGLKDNEGNISLYMYNETSNTYIKYNELTFSSIIFYALDNSEKLDFIATSIKINDIEVEGYRLEEGSDYYLIYGMNVETGLKSWYMYDAKDNTLQRYDLKTMEVVDQKNSDLYKLLTVIFGGTTLLCLVIVLVQGAKYAKLDKRVEKIFETKTNVEKIQVKEKLEDKVETLEKEEIKPEEKDGAKEKVEIKESVKPKEVVDDKEELVEEVKPRKKRTKKTK